MNGPSPATTSPGAHLAVVGPAVLVSEPVTFMVTLRAVPPARTSSLQVIVTSVKRFAVVPV